MANYSYCPKCDTVKLGRILECFSCREETVKYSYDTEMMTAIFVLTFLGSLVIMFILMRLFSHYLGLLIGSFIVTTTYLANRMSFLNLIKKIKSKGRMLLEGDKEDTVPIHDKAG